MNELVTKMVAKLQLENKYGSLSCYDYPKQYEQMIDLEVEICEALDQYDENAYSKRSSDLYENIKDIAKEIINGNINDDDLTLEYYSLHEWVEVHVTSNMCEEAKKVFESMFYYMPTENRNNWLEGNHLSNYTNTYSNVMLDYILMVHE
ncbi:hypothetical protein ORN01_25330 [Bacillus cereus]|uniref:hypothetical protein n=1 Tax=Bacillus cereus TaxID=1396 RepID=UPI002AC27177|nr:hypothetical protein [Bacillus cereus]MDZ4632282.1 hypothetical protein [Bacillus cereus]